MYGKYIIMNNMASMEPRETREIAARQGLQASPIWMRPFQAVWRALKKANWSLCWAQRLQILNLHSPCLRSFVAPRALARTATASLPSFL